MNKILLVGAGNIGSRHLQALANIKEPAVIQVVDESNDSLEVARQRFESVYDGKVDIKVKYLNKLECVNTSNDIAIVATSAGPRRYILEWLLSNTNIKYYIIEKVAFQTVADFYEMNIKFKEKDVNVWIDYCKRNIPYFQALKEKLKDESHFEMRVTGGDWGLGCNSGHYLDLFSFFTGANKFIADNSGLDYKIYDSKREGYIEFGGREIISSSKGNLIMDSIIGSTMPLFVTIQTDHYYIVIDEINNKAIEYDQDKSEKFTIRDFDNLYVSQITNVNVENILLFGKCIIPTFEDAISTNEVLLNSFIDHYNKVMKKETLICSIT